MARRNPDAAQRRRSALLPAYRGATPHTMLGPGGVIREPASESAVLADALQRLRRIAGHTPQMAPQVAADLRAVIDTLDALRAQVGQGFHRNPQVYKRLMSHDVHEVKYQHATDRKPYVHAFGGGVEMYAIERGGRRDILMTDAQGKPLWGDY